MGQEVRLPLSIAAAVAIGIAAAGLLGCGGSDEAATDSCEQVEAPKPERVVLDKPEQTVQKGEELTAVVETSCGSFEIALDTTRAPKTTNSFAYLAEEGFYDGLPFYRIAPRILIGAGDPLANGHGGPGYSVDERPPANLTYSRGTVAMSKWADDPPGRSGSRFIVVTSTESPLFEGLALLGKVDEGYDTVARIEQQGTNDLSGPVSNPVLIEEIKIERG
jgi:peptidyl-prolyl cis-trans isomerase B (cyclophilin B)